MSESMSVERQWWHDLGVAEGIDHLQDPEIAAVRREPFENDVCPDCGSEDLSAQGDLPRAACGSCGAVSDPDELTDTPAVGELDVPEGSEVEQLLEKLERVSGWSLAEWLEDYDPVDSTQVWHVPAWLADSNHLPLHDEELGTIIMGSPHRQTDDAIKFDNGVKVLVLTTKERHPRQNGHADVHERVFYEFGEWESQVQSCVGDENMSFCWTWRYEMDGTYWPFSQIHRIV